MGTASYADQQQIFDPDKFTWPVHVIGLGGIGSALLLQLTSTSQSGFFDRREIRNRGVKNAQIGQKHDGAGYYGGTPRINTIDTALAQQLTFVADLKVVNEFIRIAGYTVSLNV